MECITLFEKRVFLQLLLSLPIKAALAHRKKVVRGGFFLVFPFLVFEKFVVAAMASRAEATVERWEEMRFSIFRCVLASL